MNKDKRDGLLVVLVFVVGLCLLLIFMHMDQLLGVYLGYTVDTATFILVVALVVAFHGREVN